MINRHAHLRATLGNCLFHWRWICGHKPVISHLVLSVWRIVFNATSRIPMGNYALNVALNDQYSHLKNLAVGLFWD